MTLTDVGSGPHTNENFWIPGPLVGGIALISAPILLFAGGLLRFLAVELNPEVVAPYADHWTFFPSQLALYQNHPALQYHGYALYLVGLVCLWPAVLALARLIAPKSPKLALWGAIALVFALFGRAIWVGAELLAFQLVDIHGTASAIKTIEASYADISYGFYRFPVAIGLASFPGWILLGIGAYRSNVTGLMGALILAFGPWLAPGVLKEIHILGTVASAVSCFVFVPLGVRMLRGSLRPAGPSGVERPEPARH